MTNYLKYLEENIELTKLSARLKYQRYKVPTMLQS
jgi:hypothetical protein